MLQPTRPYVGIRRVWSYRRGVALEPGLNGSAELTVGVAHTAIALRSGDVPVLATPVVVALCEEATVDAVSSRLDAGSTTVGTSVEIDHLAPSAVGASVVALAELIAVDGRRLTFAVEVRDNTDPVARGTVTRVVVDRHRFLDALDGD